MNAVVSAAAPGGTLPASLSDEALAHESLRAQAALKRRRAVIVALRLVVLLVVLGGWELAARRKWIDPLFYSQPSLIWGRIVEWVRDGTAQGPLCWKKPSSAF